MKKIFEFLMLILLMVSSIPTIAQQEALDRNYLQINPRVGYDFPTYDNNTPYIDYKGGLDLGISVDYYWNWFGIGADFDYIKNKPENTYATTNLYSGGSLLNNFNLSEDKITRLFYGIGPNAQYRSNNGKFTAELNTRFGLANIKGGRVYLENLAPLVPLNFHAGYDDSNILTGKGQVRLTYFISPSFGFNMGAYYMHHFNTTELQETGLSSAYQPFTNGEGIDGGLVNTVNGSPQYRLEPCNCDISSIGVFAGITYKFKKKAKVCPVCKTAHTPQCCTTCGCNITITAKDKFTGDVLAHTDVVLTDEMGNVVQSGETNSYGVVVFKEVTPDNYNIKGKLYNVDLENNQVLKSDFEHCQESVAGIQKDIIYADENFILKGNVVECNTPTGIQNVDILLKNKKNAGEKHTLSDAEGNFIFHLKQVSTYILSGQKDGYYSNQVEVSTNALNRNNTLFIDFEMCVDPCGKAVKLDNINFDLDKAEILPASIPDLQHVVKLMQDNPHIKVEMSSHTDSQGSDDYNQQLSQRRADATVNYIVSQGIAQDRLIARGAGESELKNTKCKNGVPCTDEEHRINRRTEFKVICF